jgi:hypothetical protein
LGEISSRDDWTTTATSETDGARVFQQGPPLPSRQLAVLQTSGGHTRTVFYAGGCNESRDDNFKNTELWMWSAGRPAWRQLVPGDGATKARRFFVSPYQASLIYLVDTDAVRRSNDGGMTWHLDLSLQNQLTHYGRISITSGEDSSGQSDYVDMVLTDMQFDPVYSETRFAVGKGGAFFTNDGVNWSRLLHPRALPGRPANCYYDWISNPAERALYVAMAGRGLVKISPLPGVEMRVVPDVVGGDAGNGSRLVTNAGLVPHFAGVLRRHAQVVGQTPGAGQVVNPGSTVTMTLHSGL